MVLSYIVDGFKLRRKEPINIAKHYEGAFGSNRGRRLVQIEEWKRNGIKLRGGTETITVTFIGCLVQR